MRLHQVISLKRVLEHINDVLEKAKAQYADTLKEWGKKYKREKLIYTMGSGACYGEAYSFAICLLMEMQWIHSNCIHSGEYFHGPFEVTDYDVPGTWLYQTTG